MKNPRTAAGLARNDSCPSTHHLNNVGPHPYAIRIPRSVPPPLAAIIIACRHALFTTSRYRALDIYVPTLGLTN